jgi:pantoate--beta-alanine ligase
MRIIPSPMEMQRMEEEARRAGKSIGLVPTMGALHEGHLSLIRRCRAVNDLVVMSLFVNPIQFNQKDDLERYPRDVERDARMAHEAGVDFVFAPAAADMYPQGFRTYVLVEGLADRWEGASRPGHFRGVATVCAKLFTICRPHRAYFGQKDYQQSLVVRRLVADLNLGVDIVVMPTIREPDGLALSSRNVLLNPEERRQATVLCGALLEAQAAVRQGERDALRLQKTIEETVHTASLARIDYAGVCDAETLEPIEQIAARAATVLAVWFGKTRLIDNAILEP